MAQTPKSDRVRDGLDILHRRYYAGKPERLEGLEAARADDEAAREIRRLRTEAGLTQQQLAEMIGTTASAISRLEDADYEGHSLAMLRRIAGALGFRVVVRFEPLGPASAEAAETETAAA
jgi:DNA-binding XRE family transcriptional regulator